MAGGAGGSRGERERASGSPPTDIELRERIRDYWNRDAETYDSAPSHAASDVIEAAAWRAAIRGALPEPPARVLDAGAGTGSLSILAAELGYRVTALDLSPAMLERAGRKAAERGVELELVEGSVDRPPDGPFDAVVERHVLWTVPDPVSALVSWRSVAPRGRLALFEGTWGTRGPLDRAREKAAEAIRRAMGTERGHHAPYPEDVLARLPLARTSSPLPFLDAAREAGWCGIRLRRLHDVEWALGLREHPILAWLERRPRYVIVADADRSHQNTSVT